MPVWERTASYKAVMMAGWGQFMRETLLRCSLMRSVEPRGGKALGAVGAFADAAAGADRGDAGLRADLEAVGR